MLTHKHLNQTYVHTSYYVTMYVLYIYIYNTIYIIHVYHISDEMTSSSPCQTGMVSWPMPGSAEASETGWMDLLHHHHHHHHHPMSMENAHI